MRSPNYAHSPRATAQRSGASRLRLVTGCGAVIATIPYLTLKVIWILGGNLGMADPAFFHSATYFYANIVTLAMDGAAMLIALAFTSAWGLRIPAPLILLPTWLATGFLLPIVVLLPFVPATASWPARHDDPLQPWVYMMVYGGFALQGMLLLAAFALYAKARWAPLLDRWRTARVISPANPIATLLVTAASIAAGVVGVIHLTWACGGTIGLRPAFVAQQTQIDYLTHGVYGAFALGAAVGTPLLIFRVCWGGFVWVPLALSWAGTGAMFAWGTWLVTTAVASATDAPGYLFVLLVQVLAALILAFVAVRVWFRRLFGTPAETCELATQYQNADHARGSAALGSEEAHPHDTVP